MLKRLVNECRFTLTIETKGPFIIREGRLKKAETEEEKAKKVKGDPDSLPIRRVWHDNRQDFQKNQEYYLPGTSLRGVMRSHLERIVRTLLPNPPVCCDPLSPTDPEMGCSTWFGNLKAKKQPPGFAYSHACVVCRLFGCTGQASRIRIADSPTVQVPADKLSYRDHIGIDRFTGGVCSGANFRDLVIEAGVKFQNAILIRNFELWQLGLLAYVIRDFYCWEDGLIRMGYGKTKGYGQVQGVVGDIIISYYGQAAPTAPPPLQDMGDLVGEEEKKRYDLKPGTGEAGLLETYCSDWPYCTSWKVKENKKFWAAAAKAWAKNQCTFSSLETLRAAGTDSAAEPVPEVEEQP
ncbi:RAMP superfamily CRISPR-associated protein [Desulfobacca acetoxidans]